MKPIPTWRETLGNSLIFVVVGAVGQAMQQEIDALRTRLAEVEKDAARYQWLREHQAFETEAWLMGCTSEEYDEQVDQGRGEA